MSRHVRYAVHVHTQNAELAKQIVANITCAELTPLVFYFKSEHSFCWTETLYKREQHFTIAGDPRSVTVTTVDL